MIFDAQQGEGGSLEILCLTSVMEQVQSGPETEILIIGVKMKYH